MEDYSHRHEDMGIYTNLAVLDLDPIHNAYTYPKNIWLWGGTGVTASENREYADAFYREDIRFMFRTLSSLAGLMYYLTLEYGPTEAVLEERMQEGLRTVFFAKVTPGDDYTGWYEHNGMTYYFENGQAVTGTVNIDGAEYTFAPAGNKSEFVTVRGDDETVYTTGAYALITDAG